MRFTKMQGCGNDYIYINGSREKIPPEEKPELARRLSDRHFGIGGDGVIFINPAEEADFEMEMYNADGTRSEMCGNGIRCVAKFVYDKGLTDSEHITVVSAGQIRYLSMMIERQHPWDRGTVKKVRVNMGSPVLEPEGIPVMLPKGTDISGKKDMVVNEPISINGTQYHMTCVSMGNPHAVIFMDDVRNLDLEQIGPAFENHTCFPKRVNTEFVEVLDRKHVFMRVWERGTGETLACGTGCCAAAVACVLNGLTDADITVKLPGGELQIEWDRDQNLVYMTGPAETVFEGEIQESYI
ncbi:MAG: diaminopimelate epimerase [Lachnospiraceae bacterium]|nr:diaminopimelate epimerase [Butyrivibrio sp.]MCM1342226.1 diaminopimelate epimerase [Muribaculaceae bacterium]MCM1409199.1 diaminopimelate epimerase [Lachnospiraceae bacterium]